MTMYLDLSALLYRSIFLLTNTKPSLFFFTVCMPSSSILTHQHKEADLYHLISSHPDLPNPPNGVI